MPMPDWKSIATERLRRALHGAETRIDRVKYGVKRRMGWVGPARILPYRGYGTPTHFLLTGRVVEDRPVVDPRREDSWWKNLKAMYYRFESDEIPGAPVRLRSGDAVRETVTDEEGFFRFAVHREQPLPDDGLWHDVPLELIEPVSTRDTPETMTATGRVLVPRADSTLGLISDVDDTILRTHVTDALRMLRITLLGNVHTRLPFPGVAAFYRALHRGPAGSGENPVFYVSAGAWNLYDLLVAFLDINDLPAGPMLLRDFGLDREKWVAGDRMHKLHEVRRILRTYPHLPFVLVGDAGERDPQIYKRAVEEFPGRIRAIYIREGSHGGRTGEAEAVAMELREQGVDMLVVPDTTAAAVHAAESGLIDPAALDEIRRDSEANAERPSSSPQAAVFKGAGS